MFFQAIFGFLEEFRQYTAGPSLGKEKFGSYVI
jgi:hypothetical protein